MRNADLTEIELLTYPPDPEDRLAQSKEHLDMINWFLEGLRYLFRDRSHEVAVFGDMTWYPRKGKDKLRVSPDILVCFGVDQEPDKPRPSYTQFTENDIPPAVVFEMSSPSNPAHEINEKRKFYQRYGVDEYYWLDHLTGDVFVFIRQGNTLVEQEGLTEWTSPRLGIRMVWAEKPLRVFYPDGSEMVPASQRIQETEEALAEETQARQRAEQTAREEAQARQRAEQTAREEAQARLQTEQAYQQLLERMRAMGIDPNGNGN